MKKKKDFINILIKFYGIAMLISSIVLTVLTIVYSIVFIIKGEYINLLYVFAHLPIIVLTACAFYFFGLDK